MGLFDGNGAIDLRFAENLGDAKQSNPAITPESIPRIRRSLTMLTSWDRAHRWRKKV
jgi:hypothetical protein